MVSNNVLAALVGVAIVVSLGGMLANYSLLAGLPQIPITGQITGTANATVAAATTISLVINDVTFGSKNPGDSDDTSDFAPTPFVVRNDGSVDINLTITATNIWSGTDGANPSTNYRFNASVNETGSVPAANSTWLRTVTNMPASTSTAWLSNCTKFANANDAINTHIFITVPADEPSGSKSSTVTLTATQAASGSNC